MRLLSWSCCFTILRFSTQNASSARCANVNCPWTAGAKHIAVDTFHRRYPRRFHGIWMFSSCSLRFRLPTINTAFTGGDAVPRCWSPLGCHYILNPGGSWNLNNNLPLGGGATQNTHPIKYLSTPFPWSLEGQLTSQVIGFLYAIHQFEVCSIVKVSPVLPPPFLPGVAWLPGRVNWLHNSPDHRN